MQKSVCGPTKCPVKWAVETTWPCSLTDHASLEFTRSLVKLFSTKGDILEEYMVGRIGEGQWNCYLLSKAKDAAHHPTRHRTVHPPKDVSGPEGQWYCSGETPV